jgi:hypothetical protein
MIRPFIPSTFKCFYKIDQNRKAFHLLSVCKRARLKIFNVENLQRGPKLYEEVFMRTKERGNCSECRHANQQTADAAEGLWACPWLGATAAETSCEVRFKNTGDYAFEAFDGCNCTWNHHSPFRALPEGYEDQEVEINRPAFDLDTWFD